MKCIIKNQKAEYYQMIDLADQLADCSGFIEFTLNAIRVSLQQAVALKQPIDMRAEHKPDTAGH